MDNITPNPLLSTLHSIKFPNGNIASAVRVSTHADPQLILDALQMPTPKNLILLAGGAGKMDNNARLTQLFSRGVAQVASETQALLIDGGTQSGVMAMLGEGVTARGHKTPILGVAPFGKVTYPDQPVAVTGEDSAPLEPNHTHFVLLDTHCENNEGWGCETPLMYHLAEIYTKTLPALTLLVNGGNICKQEILHSVRLGIPILIVQGSGRFADELAQCKLNPPEFIEDPLLAEIIDDGELYLFPLEGSLNEFERLVYRLLRGDNTLKSAWEQFAIYDLNAKRHQKHFESIQSAILFAGVLGTLLVLLQTTWAQKLGLTSAQIDEDFVSTCLRNMIMLVPVTMTALLAISNRFNAGNKWILLRGCAESLKSEIFRYRAQAEIYSRTQTLEMSREMKLAEKMQNFSTQLMQTEVNLSALKAYEGSLPPIYSTAKQDKGFLSLTPESYLQVRLEDQLNFYVNKTGTLERKLHHLQWAIYIIGGGGTFLAAINYEIWVALSTVITAALGTYLQYQRIEEKLMKYNQAAIGLMNVRSWWVALPPAQQAQQKNIDAMVSNTEGILRSEFSSWVQEMQEAMTELKKQQTPKEDDKYAANSSSQSIQTTVTNSTISVESSLETVASSSSPPPSDSPKS
ncbi:MAG: DUF4231 domain-containing protein [Thiotrichaceae bacterium]|nr:DUF4231 domain-containing protein [Thiotrichaceae bacterium]